MFSRFVRAQEPNVQSTGATAETPIGTPRPSNEDPFTMTAAGWPPGREGTPLSRGERMGERRAVGHQSEAPPPEAGDAEAASRPRIACVVALGLAPLPDPLPTGGAREIYGTVYVSPVSTDEQFCPRMRTG